MLVLPSDIMALLVPFAPLFSSRIWRHIPVLVAGAILAPGRRMVRSVLRTVGLTQLPSSQTYHRVLNRAVWSSLGASRILFGLLLATFVPAGPLVVGIDETTERRRGKRITAAGIYRDPVRSSRSHLVKVRGLHWMCTSLLVPIPWAARVQELEGRLAKDSHNSSKPPSSDGLRRKPKSLREKSGKRRGGQPGHRGHPVSLVAIPDAVETHRPSQCGACQRELPGDAPSWVERRQVQELPPVRLHVTEHQILHVRCPGCGATTAAQAPTGVSAPQQYGPRVRAVASYLVQQQFVPYARVRELFAEVFGAALSVGTVVNLVRLGAARLHGVEEEIKTALRQAPVLHHDETGLRVVGAEGARLEWTHVTCTRELTHYARHAARGAAALEATGILPGFRGVSLHDGWTSYRHYRTCRHALCNAHHLRELTFVDEELHQTWAGKLKRLLGEMRTAMEQVRAAGATHLQRAVRDDFIARYEALLGEGLAQNPQPPPPVGRDGTRRRGRRKQSPVRNLLDRLWLHEDEVLLFLDEVAVPFDNNQAERDLRMVKVQQKVSGTFCSDAGADAFCRIRSVCSTWRKQGRSVLDALEAAFAGRSLSLHISS